VSQQFDVVVVGFGYAGGISAIAAHDAGARVLLLEKQSEACGISVCSGGGVRCSQHPEQALAYLLATNGATTPEPVIFSDSHGPDVGGHGELNQAMFTKTPDSVGVCVSTGQAGKIRLKYPGLYFH
jgi:choline dehydrogenase-like flavoprotein